MKRIAFSFLIQLAFCLSAVAAVLPTVNVPERSFPIHNDGGSPPVYDTLTNNTLVKIGSDGAILNATSGTAIGSYEGKTAGAHVGIVKLFGATARVIQSAGVACGADVMQDSAAPVKVKTASGGGKIIGTKIYPASSGSAGDTIEIILSPTASTGGGTFNSLTVGTSTTTGSLAVTTNATVGGTLAVTGAASFAGGATLASSVITNSLTVGGGDPIIKILTGAATLDFGSVATNTTADLTITVTGAGTNSVVIPGLPAAANTNFVFNMFVSATNTVTVRAANISTAAVDPEAGSYRATVIQY